MRLRATQVNYIKYNNYVKFISDIKDIYYNGIVSVIIHVKVSMLVNVCHSFICEMFIGVST